MCVLLCSFFCRTHNGKRQKNGNKDSAEQSVSRKKQLTCRRSHRVSYESIVGLSAGGKKLHRAVRRNVRRSAASVTAKLADECHVCENGSILGKRDVIVLIAAEEGPRKSHSPSWTNCRKEVSCVP